MNTIIDIIMKEARVDKWSLLQEQQLENTVNQIFAKFKNKLIDKQPDDKYFLNHSYKDYVKEIKAPYFENAKIFNNYIIKNLKNIDFKNEKLILAWLIEQIFKETIDKDKIEEDKDTITQAIQLYFDNKGKIAKNIYTSNYSDLKSWIQEYLPKGEESKHQEFLSKPVAEGNGYKIYKITTVGQCVKIGKGTSWCIQGKKWATSYLKNGPLWLITKNDKRFALLQPVSGSYMDVNDNSLSPEVMFEIIDAWPDLKGLLLENSDKFPLQYFKYTKDVPEEAFALFLVRYHRLNYQAIYELDQCYLQPFQQNHVSLLVVISLNLHISL